MDRQQEHKLNLLLRAWPRGTVALSSYLLSRGIYRQLAARYVQYGWIKSIGRGAYVREGDKSVSWPGGIFALQQQLKLQIHISGKTALEQKGYAHYLPVKGAHTVWLTGASRVKLPKWFRTHDWGVTICYQPSGIFTGNNASIQLVRETIYGVPVTIASPERAIFELLEQVPAKESFSEAHQIMENLTALRPRVVSDILRACTSIKTKRLFLFLADYCKHPWFKYLDIARVSLGAGKCSLVKAGKYDRQYKITVPAEFIE